MDYNKLQEQYPFITIARYADSEYQGIIQNSSKNITTMFCINLIKDKDLLIKFLSFGEEWWYQSNRQISISVFLKNEMSQFHFCIRSFVSKDFNILYGPKISLSLLVKKRVKRKGIIFLKQPSIND